MRKVSSARKAWSSTRSLIVMVGEELIISKTVVFVRPEIATYRAPLDKVACVIGSDVLMDVIFESVCKSIILASKLPPNVTATGDCLDVRIRWSI